MPISGDRREASNSMLVNKIVDFAAFHVRAAVIPASKAGVSGAGPRLGQAGRKVLRVGAHVQRGRGVTPDLPRRL
jgi:hypothetical protein